MTGIILGLLAYIAECLSWWTLFAAAAFIYKVCTIFLQGDPILHEERSLWCQIFAHYGAGLGLFAFGDLLLKVGIASRAIKAHHWRFAGASLIAIARTMFAITDTPLRYHNISQKHLLWARASNASQAIAFTPLYFLSPAIISRGALYTLATLASTTWCNMTATTSADPELGN
uniref:Uncharacterized protein n=1 Tax=Moniliophthora roreri TaxID=221103 RepID=A0A0W0EU58_MONRR